MNLGKMYNPGVSPTGIPEQDQRRLWAVGNFGQGQMRDWQRQPFSPMPGVGAPTAQPQAPSGLNVTSGVSASPLPFESLSRMLGNLTAAQLAPARSDLLSKFAKSGVASSSPLMNQQAGASAGQALGQASAQRNAITNKLSQASLAELIADQTAREQSGIGWADMYQQMQRQQAGGVSSLMDALTQLFGKWM